MPGLETEVEVSILAFQVAFREAVGHAWCEEKAQMAPHPFTTIDPNVEPGEGPQSP